MAVSFNKREQEKRRQQKQEEKARKKAERKANSGGGGLDSMLAYVDENGMIVDTPPDPTKRQEINAEDIELGVPRRVDVVPERRIGKVDFFDASRGFGFILENGSNERFFVHVSELDGPVQDGQTVTFDVERGARGMNAVRVSKG
ncbi:MAG: cold shock domain-containing protein [Flavobacteriales bacterium]|jgi:cold shock CspA family protein|nr:MAG: cold shock domain-containing protein [Flavobacteriales bacterium]